MGFDAGFSWKVVFLLLPFWAYPALILICGTIALFLNRREHQDAAIVTIVLPLVISWGWLALMMGIAERLHG
jgi:hypothetical protein